MNVLSLKRPSLWLNWVLFGPIQFPQRQEYQEFRYKLAIILMVAGALLTGLFILGQLSAVNPIGWPHMGSMVFFTSTSLVIWLLLRGRPQRFKPLAWVYELVCLWEYTSSLLYVPADELRILWFFTNVPGVFILLGQRAGWVITLGSAVGMVLINPHLSHPYSPNAIATGFLGMLFLGFTFQAFANRSMSYLRRMYDFNAQLDALASHDPLTGVMNARAYYNACEQQIHAAQRSGQSFAVLFVDLDHFKSINDAYGHAAGDEVLRTVAQTLQGHLRASDLLGRIGGEEFSVFLAGTELAGAKQVAEQLRHAVEACEPRAGEVQLRVTASIGVAARGTSAPSMKLIQQQADEAMYLAKKAGRNRVSIFETQAPVPASPASLAA